MVEHPDAGGYLEVTVPVYVELNVDAGLVGFSLYGGDSLGHRSSLLESDWRHYLGFTLYGPLVQVEPLAGTGRHNIAECLRGCLLTHGDCSTPIDKRECRDKLEAKREQLCMVSEGKENGR
jgi:hypothetical protein